MLKPGWITSLPDIIQVRKGDLRAWIRQIRNADGTEEILTDDQFNRELGVTVKGGTIYNTDENGNQVVAGTYERIWF